MGNFDGIDDPNSQNGDGEYQHDVSDPRPQPILLSVEKTGMVLHEHNEVTERQSIGEGPADRSGTVYGPESSIDCDCNGDKVLLTASEPSKLRTVH